MLQPTGPECAGPSPVAECQGHLANEAEFVICEQAILIRDNDDRYGERFTRVARGTTIDVLRTPVRAPKANAICERFMGSVRRECLDHLIILSERQLYRIIDEYVSYFNHARPHQGIGSCIPDPIPDESNGDPGTGQVVAYPVLGGLHHDYRRAA